MYGNPEFMRHRPQRRLAIGIAASLAAHVLLVIAFRAESTRELIPAMPDPVESLIVFVKPPPRPPVPDPKPVVRGDKAAPAARRSSQPERQVDDRVEDSPQADLPPTIIATDTPKPEDDPFYVQPAPPEKPFDMAAARAAARQVATSADPARADLPVGQFDKERNRVKPDDPVARKIAQAKRRDCKDGIPGGLLAPLLLLMDKKDHGCKW